MNNILISACLLGKPVRYDGNHSLIEHPLIKQWQQQNQLIPLCPEVEGGLPIPRAPAEIINPSLILKEILIKSHKILLAYRTSNPRRGF